MMEIIEGRRVFSAAPHPSAEYVLIGPGEEEYLVDLGNIPMQPILDVLDFISTRFGSFEEASAETLVPSDLFVIAGLVLRRYHAGLSPEGLGGMHPDAVLPFVQAVVSEQIMPQVKAAFGAMQLKNG